MLPRSLLLLVLPSLALAAPSLRQAQEPFLAPAEDSPPPPPKGRFLHITDIHPDSHYTPYTRPTSACHSSHFGKKTSRVAGYWGTPLSDCDSPLRLVDLTLAFVEQWAGEVDWVVWTGDSARHDNDPQLARTEEEIEGSNRYLTERMREIFGSRGVGVVPSIGNNDVWPHNVMYPGPSSTTRTYEKMWSPLLPSSHPASNLSSLPTGLYFTVPLLPTHKIAAISLNTLYLYDSNKAVDGCVEEDDAGSVQMRWLGEELERLRREGWRVWLVGHVPPSGRLWYAGCYKKYGELALRYQDTILGHLYGHMNMDHYFWISLEEVEAASGKPKPKSTTSYDSLDEEEDDPPLRTLNHNFDHSDLLKDLKSLPKLEKIDYADYAVVNVPASVVPTYFPGVRVYTWNTTGTWPVPPIERNSSSDHAASVAEDDSGETLAKECKGHKTTSNCISGHPRHASPHSPTRHPGPFSLTGYAQYYLPGLVLADENTPPAWEMEYATYSLEGWNRSLEAGEEVLPRDFVPVELGGHMRWRGGMGGPGEPEEPEEPEEPPEGDELLDWAEDDVDTPSTSDPSSGSEADEPTEEIKTKKDKKDKKKKDKKKKEKKKKHHSKQPKPPKPRTPAQLLPYDMPDLTIPSWLKLARRLTKEKKVWKEFRRNMYVSSGADE